MKCPVCLNECTKNDTKCSVCGFTELHVELINLEEAEIWERTVLKPCRALWRATNSMYNVALDRLQNLAIEGPVTGNTNGVMYSASTGPRATGSGKWVVDKLVSYQDVTTCHYAFGGVTCKIFKVESSKNGDGSITITYLVSKVRDSKGETATSDVRYRYKLKDEDGVVIKNDYEILYGLRVGDVAKKTMVISNPTSTRYSIEFVDKE